VAFVKSGELDCCLPLILIPQTVCKKIVQEAIENGVICFWFLSCPDSFRIAPPLTISDEEIAIACDVIKKAIDKAYA